MQLAPGRPLLLRADAPLGGLCGIHADLAHAPAPSSAEPTTSSVVLAVLAAPRVGAPAAGLLPGPSGPSSSTKPFCPSLMRITSSGRGSRVWGCWKASGVVPSGVGWLGPPPSSRPT